MTMIRCDECGFEFGSVLHNEYCPSLRCGCGLRISETERAFLRLFRFRCAHTLRGDIAALVQRRDYREPVGSEHNPDPHAMKNE